MIELIRRLENTIRKLIFICFCCTLSLGALANKSATFQDITIYRDSYGVPHIYGNNNYQVFFGYGYAVAQDRLFQLEMLKRTASGQVSEVLGADYIAYDTYIRSSFDSRSIAKQIEELPKKKREIIQAYADGINHYLEKISNTPAQLTPKEFVDYNFTPSRWTAKDVAMLFVGSLANRYSDFNTEIDNLKFLRQQQRRHGNDTGWQVFSATKWLLDNNSPTTVPFRATDDHHVDSAKPDYLNKLAKNPSGSAHLAFNYIDNKAPLLLPSASHPKIASTFKQAGVNGTPGFESASNIWMANAGKISDAKGAMINGPQFGWSTPSYVYGVGLHGGDYNVVGNTLFALPALLFAHNNHIGWGATAGFGDQVDIFEEQLVNGNSDYYLHRGKKRAFEKWQEIIKVKNQQDTVITARRSIHGMVQSFHPTQSIAYAKQRAWEGKELQSLLAWTELATKKSIEDSKPLLNDIATNINFYIMDKGGDMLYRLAGHYPIRSEGVDRRLPTPGTGEYDWLGMHNSSYNPSTTNPKTKYIINWNNRPTRDWSSPDLWWVTWYRADRADVLIDELMQKPSHTVKEFWEINQTASFKDVNLAYLSPYMVTALDGKLTDKTEIKAWQLIKDWDGYWLDENQDGLYDAPAAKIFDAFLQNLLSDVLLDDLGELYFDRFAPTGSPNNQSTSGINVQPGTKVIVRTMDQISQGKVSYDFFNNLHVNDVIKSTFKKSINELKAHDSNPENWQAKPYPLVYTHKNFRGIPQTLKSAIHTMSVSQNRGSENNLFIAKGDHIEAWDVYGPGQSGFIYPDGKKHKHHGDQMDLYEDFELKKIPFNFTEMNISSTEVIKVAR